MKLKFEDASSVPTFLMVMGWIRSYAERRPFWAEGGWILRDQLQGVNLFFKSFGHMVWFDNLSSRDIDVVNSIKGRGNCFIDIHLDQSMDVLAWMLLLLICWVFFNFWDLHVDFFFMTRAEIKKFTSIHAASMRASGLAALNRASKVSKVRVHHVLALVQNLALNIEEYYLEKVILMTWRGSTSQETV
ncbi:hypothetical protein E3N88_40297 [Mikania micrantha]|uniref:Uncharacterized protein n=1 Tax=Mikania micrantha TaxID=192012 RepID=A0A5N6LM65_9ASTR|nr:hypothetical protein E3N88_40297 [Mikania micrantha]